MDSKLLEPLQTNQIGEWKDPADAMTAANLALTEQIAQHELVLEQCGDVAHQRKILEGLQSIQDISRDDRIYTIRYRYGKDKFSYINTTGRAAASKWKKCMDLYGDITATSVSLTFA